MTASIFFFAREKLQKQLREEGTAMIGVSNPQGYPDVIMPPHLKDQRTITFHVGQGLGLPAPVTFDDTDRVISWTGHFEGRGRFPVRIPYECISFVKPGPNCGGPNGGRRITA